MDKELLTILVCPLCKVSLEHKKDDGLFCNQCNRLYPIRDEIPVMFIEEAKVLLPKEEK